MTLPSMAVMVRSQVMSMSVGFHPVKSSPPPKSYIFRCSIQGRVQGLMMLMRSPVCSWVVGERVSCVLPAVTLLSLSQMVSTAVGAPGMSLRPKGVNASLIFLPSMYMMAPRSSPCHTKVVLLRPMPRSTMPEALMRRGWRMFHVPSLRTMLPRCPLASGFICDTSSMARWIRSVSSPSCHDRLMTVGTSGMTHSDAW